MQRHRAPTTLPIIVLFTVIFSSVVILGACGAEPDSDYDYTGWADADGGQDQQDDDGYDASGSGDTGDDDSEDIVGDVDGGGSSDGDGTGAPHEDDDGADESDGGVSEDASTSTDAFEEDLLRRQGDATPPNPHDGAND